MSASSISVVVPALDEAAAIAATIQALRHGGFDDIVVADGGSGDATADVARAAGAAVVAAQRGRAAQMNAGAAESAGEVLLFLHADTRLPSGAADLISAALRDPRVVAGAFRLRFDRSHPVLAASAWFTRFETGLTTFGDQAIFVRRQAFDALGGYPVQPLMEDVEFRRRVRRIGRFVKLEAEVVTSARRYDRGVLRQQMLNGFLLAAYRLGASPERLSRIYR